MHDLVPSKNALAMRQGHSNHANWDEETFYQQNGRSLYRVVVRIIHQAYVGEAVSFVNAIIEYLRRETGCEVHIFTNCIDFTLIVNVLMSLEQQRRCTEQMIRNLASDLHSHCQVDYGVYADGAAVLAPNAFTINTDGRHVFNRQVSAEMLRRPVEELLTFCIQSGPLWDFSGPAAMFSENVSTGSDAVPEAISLLDIAKTKVLGKRVSCKAVFINEIKSVLLPKVIEKRCITHSNMCDNVGCAYSKVNTIYIGTSDEILVHACTRNSGQMEGFLAKWFCVRKMTKIKVAITARQRLTIIAANPYVDRLQHTGEVKPQVIYLIGETPPSSGLIEVTGRVVLTGNLQPVVLADTWHSIADLQPSVRTDGFEVFKINRPEAIVKSIQQSIGIHGSQKEPLVLADLLWLHSPLILKFDERIIRGTLDICEIGDTGQAKTYRKRQLNALLGGLVEIVECQTSSRTGTIYSIASMKSVGEYIELGALPLNNGGAVVLDEIQSLESDDIMEMRSVRSSGILKVNRRVKGVFPANLRLYMVGNPTKGKAVRDYDYPVTMLKEVFHAPDIRRFDLAIITSAEDVDGQETNKPNGAHKKVPEFISADALSRSVKWAWQLRPEQIEFEDDAVISIYEESRRLSEKFGMAADIHLALSSDLNQKIARLAAAYATTFHNTNEDHTMVFVLKEHVRSVVMLMDIFYSGPNMRLDAYSSLRKKETLSEEKFQEVNAWLTTKAGKRDNLEQSLRLMKLLAAECPIGRPEIMEKLHMKKDALNKRMDFLKCQGMVIVEGSRYQTTALFQVFYKKWKSSWEE